MGDGDGGGDDYDDSDHGDDDGGGDGYSNYDYVYEDYQHISMIANDIAIPFIVNVNLIMAITMTMMSSIAITMIMTPFMTIITKEYTDPLTPSSHPLASCIKKAGAEGPC